MWVTCFHHKWKECSRSQYFDCRVSVTFRGLEPHIDPPPLLPPSPPPLQNAWHFILMNHYLNLLHQGSQGHGSQGEPEDRGDHEHDAVGQATGSLWSISCQFRRRDARWSNEAQWTCCETEGWIIPDDLIPLGLCVCVCSGLNGAWYYVFIRICSR